MTNIVRRARARRLKREAIRVIYAGARTWDPLS